MIDITPKALRFARMAAEQQPMFARDPQIAAIRREEEAWARRAAGKDRGHGITISEAMAEFCRRAMGALLDHPDRFETDEWDANDFVFMRSVTRSLQKQLMKTSAQVF